jgi:thiamine-phosphate pyrophosphorylase
MRVPRILAISPPDPAGAAAWVARAPALVAAGADGLLLRVIAEEAPEVSAWLAALDATGATVLVHARTPGRTHHPRHLSATAGAPAGAFGRSCHSASDLRAAAAEGASWATLSPVFPPGSKPEDRRPTLGLDGLAAACRAAPVPVLALGGVDADTAGACVAAGAWGVAGIGAFGSAEGIAAIAAGLSAPSR